MRTLVYTKAPDAQLANVYHIESEKKEQLVDRLVRGNHTILGIKDVPEMEANVLLKEARCMLMNVHKCSNP